MNWEIFIFVSLILIVHEFGHYTSAKLLNLEVEKVGFAIKPFPRFYVSVIDSNITLRKRLIYLLSGNFTTLLIFICLLLFGVKDKNLYYAFAFQIIVETNPFYSDYIVATIYYLSIAKFKKQYMQKKQNMKTVETKQNIIIALQKEHLFSMIWYIHFLLWALIIVVLLSPKLLMQFIN